MGIKLVHTSPGFGLALSDSSALLFVWKNLFQSEWISEEVDERLVCLVFCVDKMVLEEVTEGRLADHTDGSHVSSLGGSSGQTGPGWVTAHAGGAEQTQHRPGQPHITPLVAHHYKQVILSNTQ